jgi:hypothetical protein
LGETGDALAARAFISFARPKETNQRKAAGCISEAKNRAIFPKTAKRASLERGRFFTGKITRFSSRFSEEAGTLSAWVGVGACRFLVWRARQLVGKTRWVFRQPHGFLSAWVLWRVDFWYGVLASL